MKKIGEALAKTVPSNAFKFISHEFQKFASVHTGLHSTEQIHHLFVSTTLSRGRTATMKEPAVSHGW